MWIFRILRVPCPRCHIVGKFGNLNVSQNILRRGCNACGYRQDISLPELKKRVLYLDQSFLSNAFRERDERYMRAATRISDLTHRQLLVCPRSFIHEDETHLWRSEHQEALWAFVKRTARGNEFELGHYVKEAQLFRSFDAFLEGGNVAIPVERHDALSTDIDDWEDYLHVEVGEFKTDWDAVRTGKLSGAIQLVDQFDTWRREPKTFEQDRILEADRLAGALIHLYHHAQKLLGQREYTKYWNSPIDGNAVGHLLEIAVGARKDNNP